MENVVATLVGAQGQPEAPEGPQAGPWAVAGHSVMTVVPTQLRAGVSGAVTGGLIGVRVVTGVAVPIMVPGAVRTGKASGVARC